jgi:Arc/MetJ-type ribon-helix-helix transcriptional regulator
MYMTLKKARLTVTVDAELAEAANAAVESGAAESVSAYVNDALTVQSARQRRLAAMERAVKAYEAEFGEITEEEMAEQRRQDRANAIIVRHGKVFYPDSTSEDADGNIIDAEGNILRTRDDAGL